jgi:pseudaminic acid synthase
MIININKKIKIDNNSKTLLIAEISANHLGDKKRFIKHIQMAKKCGADLVKIQSYEENDISLNINNKKFKNIFNVYKKAKTPFKWHKDAFQFAKKNKITLFSSPFSTRAVDLLEDLDCPIYKIASLEITNFQLIKKISLTKKPIIMSIGASNINEVKRALKVINKHHNKVILLYCVSAYPTKESEMNVKSIEYLKKKFKNNFIGLSDHTKSIHSSLIASICGAKVIEKHFVIDGRKTYDSKFSILPKELTLLAKNLKKYKLILGDSKHSINNNEFDKRRYRRSFYAKKNIKKGEKFDDKNIISLRPNLGLCASNYFKLIKKKSKKNYKKLDPISKNEIF